MQLLQDEICPRILQNFLRCVLPSETPEAQQWICGEEMEDRSAREVRKPAASGCTPNPPGNCQRTSPEIGPLLPSNGGNEASRAAAGGPTNLAALKRGSEERSCLSQAFSSHSRLLSSISYSL